MLILRRNLGAKVDWEIINIRYNWQQYQGIKKRRRLVVVVQLWGYFRRGKEVGGFTKFESGQ